MGFVFKLDMRVRGYEKKIRYIWLNKNEKFLCGYKKSKLR